MDHRTGVTIVVPPSQPNSRDAANMLAHFASQIQGLCVDTMSSLAGSQIVLTKKNLRKAFKLSSLCVAFAALSYVFKQHERSALAVLGAHTLQYVRVEVAKQLFLY